MVVASLAELPPVDELAVIINVGLKTKHVATLALLSTLRYARVPAVVIDCEYPAGFEWFKRMMQAQEFHLMRAQLKPHGETLDWIFRTARARRILLVDSDIEVLNTRMLDDMRSLLDRDASMYGAGFLHEGHWLPRHFNTNLPLAPGIGYYMGRAWIPFALLRTDRVREALSDGSSFMDALVINECMSMPVVSKLLWRRFRFAVFRKHRLDWMDRFRVRREGSYPAYLRYDTGAQIHEYLAARGYGFGGINAAHVPLSVSHLDGASRAAIHGDKYDSCRLSDAETIARDRLLREYRERGDLDKPEIEQRRHS